MSRASERIVPATPRSVASAASALSAGELVAFPTETVYGLGADASNPVALAKIFAAKGRPADHPLIVHLAGASALSEWAREIPSDAFALARVFWPGPLTLILTRAHGVSDKLTGGQESLGVRVPSHPVAQALLGEFARLGGKGIAAPSANRFGHVSPTLAEHVAADLPEVGMILDGGACDVGIESTIVAFQRGQAVLLRPGGIGIDDLVRVLGREPRRPDVDSPRASGMLASHYATRTQSFIVAADAMTTEVAQREDRDECVAVLARTLAAPPEFAGHWLRAPSNPVAYAHDLYANLRMLDGENADAILIEAVPETNEWLAVRDRLARATHDASDDRD